MNFKSAGNFDSSGGGTFTHNSGAIILDADTNHSFLGAPGVNDLTLQDTTDNATDVTITFDAGQTVTINGTLTLDGLDATDRLNIISDSGGSAATLDFQGTSTFSGDFLDILDSTVTDNSSGITLPINPADSVDGGNTSGWFAGISGTVYTDEGSTTITDGRTVNVLVNGVSVGTDTTSSGAYSVTGISLSAADIITVYIDGAAEDGVMVTRSDGDNMTDADVYQDRLIVRSEDATAISNTNLDTGNDGDADITAIFADGGTTSLTTASGKEVFVWTGDSYTPGGTIDAGGNIDVDGTLHSAANAINVEGDMDVAGTLTHTGTLTLDGGSAQTLTLGAARAGALTLTGSSARTVTLGSKPRHGRKYPYLNRR